MVDRPERPGGLDFRSESFDPPSNASQLSLNDLPSPRAGEIPPALSPLDALALQGRLLAKRFDQENKAGRRMSRLAPLTIQNEFGHRNGYFASMSNSTSPNEDQLPTSPARPRISPRETSSADRHKSLHPQFGYDNPRYEQPLPYRSNMTPIGERETPRSGPRGYFDIPRTASPEPVMKVQGATPVSPTLPPTLPRSDSQHHVYQPYKRPSADSLSVRPQQQPGLLPPKSPSLRDRSRDRSPRVSPSIRSVPGDSSDEVENTSYGGSYDSLRARNFSSSSNHSRAHSPYTPFSNPTIPRSPSVSSEYSMGGSQLPRPAFNFSRPLSSASREIRPSVDISTPQAIDENAMSRPSFDSLPRRQDSTEGSTTYTGEMIHTPISMTSEDFRRSGDFANNPVPSYTYSKFDLPRGRKLDRKSIGIEDFLNSQITWAETDGKARARPPSPESPPRSLAQQRVQNGSSPSRSASMDRGAPSLTSSNSTIRARPEGAADITAQEHCDKGIELHEAGEFMKSTYHLRLAARAGLPEAMFWYGLACRHGWGMRENKAEALQWLRRAVDSGQLEVADDEDLSKHGQTPDFVKSKQHKARYAVAIYELGKCYMNGWGTSPDKSLALRCYEIAGNWGDADALSEAGYCYVEGVGCKKNMKKAATFYRAAEAKGVSMVGNSW
jgi:hypothetical protein